MSVRRLAEDRVQPAAFAFNDENARWAEATIRKYPEGREQSAVIPLLMRAQDQEGWVSKAAIEKIADMLGMAYIRVLEVATFYTQFQLQPVGTRAHIQVCGTTPCMLRGAEDLIAVCKSKIHAEPHHLNADGTLSWEEVECLGACVNAPMVAIFKDTFEDLTARQLEYIIERFEAGKAADVKPGPQIDRIFSAPVGGPTALLEDVVPVRTNLDAPVQDGGAAPTLPPAEAAKPKTDAIETAPAIKSPADGKSAAPEGEGARPAKAQAKPALDDPNRPAAIARPDKPDDLKMLSGVGPKTEIILHDIGIFTYAQVAALTPEQREWVDGYLSFKGRIERENWVGQAKALAEGGEEEYIRVFGKKPR